MVSRGCDDLAIVLGASVWPKPMVHADAFPGNCFLVKQLWSHLASTSSRQEAEALSVNNESSLLQVVEVAVDTSSLPFSRRSQLMSSVNGRRFPRESEPNLGCIPFLNGSRFKGRWSWRWLCIQCIAMSAEQSIVSGLAGPWEAYLHILHKTYKSGEDEGVSITAIAKQGRGAWGFPAISHTPSISKLSRNFSA